MEETPAEPSYELEVGDLYRPLVGMGLIGRWREFVCDATHRNSPPSLNELPHLVSHPMAV